MERLTLVSMAVLSLGCGQGASQCKANLTGSYPSERFVEATQNERALNARFEALIAAMEDTAADPPVLTTRAALDTLFTSGTPSVSSLTSPAFVPTMNELFDGVVAAQGKTFVASTPPTSGGRGAAKKPFSERGVNLAEYAEKGLFGAMVFKEAVARLPKATTPETIDQLVALYGAPPTFPLDDSTSAEKNVFTAGYAKRRTPPGGTGVYTALRDAFTTARLAVGAPGCDAERQAALETVQREWEKVLVITTIYYLNAAQVKLEDGSADATKKLGALGNLSEAVGFLNGLRFVPAERRTLTDGDLEALLTTLKTPSLATSSLHRYATDVPADTQSLVNAKTMLQARYGFTTDEMAKFVTAF